MDEDDEDDDESYEPEYVELREDTNGVTTEPRGSLFSFLFTSTESRWWRRRRRPDEEEQHQDAPMEEGTMQEPLLEQVEMAEETVADDEQ